MSYPRGDTFLIPVQCVREASQTHTHTHTHTQVQIGDTIEMTMIGFIAMAGKIQDDMEET